MSAFDQFALVASLGGVTLMGLLVYADYRVKKADRILEHIRSEREAAE